MNYKSAKCPSNILFAMGLFISIVLFPFKEADFWFLFVAVLAVLLIAVGFAIIITFYR